jgi:hypothetical protein
VHEKRARLDVGLAHLAVHGDGDLGHKAAILVPTVACVY